MVWQECTCWLERQDLTAPIAPVDGIRWYAPRVGLRSPGGLCGNSLDGSRHDIAAKTFCPNTRERFFGVDVERLRSNCVCLFPPRSFPGTDVDSVTYRSSELFPLVGFIAGKDVALLRCKADSENVFSVTHVLLVDAARAVRDASLAGSADDDNVVSIIGLSCRFELP